MEMSLDDGPNNSIRIIEGYINRRKASLPQCIERNQLPDDPFEFRQEHQIEIQKFLCDIKLKHAWGYNKTQSKRDENEKNETLKRQSVMMRTSHP